MFLCSSLGFLTCLATLVRCGSSPLGLSGSTVWVRQRTVRTATNPSTAEGRTRPCVPTGRPPPPASRDLGRQGGVHLWVPPRLGPGVYWRLRVSTGDSDRHPRPSPCPGPTHRDPLVSPFTPPACASWYVVTLSYSTTCASLYSRRNFVLINIFKCLCVLL